jgi:hypothetical protein
MPDPRTIALEKNDPSMFADGEAGYDPEAGVPSSVAGTRPQRDYAANPTNPAEPAAPCKNLKR